MSLKYPVVRPLARSFIFLNSLIVMILMSGCGDSAQSEPVVGAGKETASQPVEPPEGMVYIPGGSFMMGGDAGEMGGDSNSHQTSYPIRDVYVDSFWMDATEVTNRQFAEFVEATGYVTFAERPLPEEVVLEYTQMAEANLARMKRDLDFVDDAQRPELEAAIERLKQTVETLHLSGAILFKQPEGALFSENDTSQWWQVVPGATWKTPSGPGSSIEGLEDHPVVNVTHEDAAAYAKWAGKRLPTEAEWEKAARGGLLRKPFVWGDDFSPMGEEVWMANIWQGAWPYQNTAEDGYELTSPVKSFPPNAYGLYDIAGNVWEIVGDLYHPHAYEMREPGAINPTGPTARQVAYPGQRLVRHITRGGSFLCSDGWCKGYQPGSRQPIDNESPANHTGFRCVKDIPKT
ncbi:MAG: formylglycine-generating enzyme family protein [Opitutales bacterium]